jgi:CRISPR/Cas system-associated protein Csm6
MTEAEARALLEDGTQWQSDPALTVAEVDRLLARARVTDINFVEPDGVGYIDTWTVGAINAQVAEGWRMKAGRIAGSAFDVKAGDVEAKRSQRHAALLRQAGGGGSIGVITLTTGLV